MFRVGDRIGFGCPSSSADWSDVIITRIDGDMLYYEVEFEGKKLEWDIEAEHVLQHNGKWLRRV